MTGAIFFFEVSSHAAHQLLPFCPCACGVLITVAIGGPFSPLVGTHYMPLGPYAVGDCCVTKFARPPYIPCMLFFCVLFPLLYLEVHFGSFVKYAVPDDGGFCVVFISTDKISEVVPITVTVPRPLPTSMFFLLCSSLSFGSLFRIFLNTWYWMSVCSHPHKLSVTVVFCDVIIFAG